MTPTTGELGRTFPRAADRVVSRVNSWDEWSPLREVVVGSPVNFDLPSPELSFKLFFHDNVDRDFWHTGPGKTGDVTVKRQYLEELYEDVDEFASALTDLDVLVHRPLEMPSVVDVRTPYWESSPTPALNVRDQTMVLGDEIVETPPQVRSRYFENDLLKPLFYRYFAAGSRWTVMPRPVMTDRSFDLSYVRDGGCDGAASEAVYRQEPSPYDVGVEMMIDAAQFTRFGRDVLVNVTTEHNELAVRWLERHCGGAFRFHRVYRMTDNHLDSTVLPLRPGLLLVRHEGVRDMLPEPLRKWDVLSPPEPSPGAFPDYDDTDLMLASRFVDLNVLSISPDTVVVNSLYPELVKLLENEGMTVVPVRHRHRRLVGGGFHCFTLDTVREGGPEDYFG